MNFDRLKCVNNNVNLNASYTYISVENDEGDGFKKDYNYMPNVPE